MANWKTRWSIRWVFLGYHITKYFKTYLKNFRIVFSSNNKHSSINNNNSSSNNNNNIRSFSGSSSSIFNPDEQSESSISVQSNLIQFSPGTNIIKTFICQNWPLFPIQQIVVMLVYTYLGTQWIWTKRIIISFFWALISCSTHLIPLSLSLSLSVYGN